MNIDKFDLSVRTYNCLRTHAAALGVNPIDDLFVFIESLGDTPRERARQLLRAKNFGRKSVKELAVVLADHGRADILPLPVPPREPGQPRPLVPRCPHCDQRLPKHMRGET